MPSTSYGNQPPHNGPGYHLMGTSTQQQQYGVGASSQYQQPLAGPMPPGKPPEQFPGYGGMSGGMMSGGGMTAMAGPPLSNSTAGIVCIVNVWYYLCIINFIKFNLLVIHKMVYCIAGSFRG